MKDNRKEYLEFGPWLLTVQTEEDITHQFKHMKKEILSADLAVKIPVEKEWRTIHEGDLLYETVVTLDEAGINCIRVLDNGAYACRLNYSDIVNVRLHRGLLVTELEINTESESIELQYMPAPVEVADKLQDMIIEGYVKYSGDIHLNRLKLGSGMILYRDGYEPDEGKLKSMLAVSVG